MKIRKECIGSQMGSKIGFISIEDNPEKFKLYKILGLDVFEKVKKNDSNKKSNNKPEHSVDPIGENDNK